MKSIEAAFYDKEGNHLMVALDFYDDDYKQNTLQIPEEYSDIEIVDINIEKADLKRPISCAAFFKMTTWLVEQFKTHENAIFTYICSISELETNHKGINPQEYRRDLFDALLQRVIKNAQFNVQDIVLGPEGFLTFGRAFYRDRHSPIVYIATSYLKEKQREYMSL